ncbi:MAG: hypothetical protein RL556_723 [Actinomycetota bacterium]|jgi:Holliday junction DNA helicase RuvA
MIASLRGEVLANSGQALIVDVSGVGYQVFVTAETARKVTAGDSVFLYTALIVREDAFTIFGFLDNQELEIFDLLRSVSGVGPKSALGVLSEMTPDQVGIAVKSENDAAFKAVTGIGPKTAKLIVVTLTGKLNSFGLGATSARVKTVLNLDSVVEALKGLGWAERQAAEAVQAAASSLGDSATADSLLRNALSRLGASKVTNS